MSSIAARLAALACAPLLISAMPVKPTTPSARHLCQAGEAALFSCSARGKMASVCSAPGQISYRYGKRGAVEIDLASNGHDDRAYKSSVVGGGVGGRQDSVRFLRGTYSYVLSAGVAGAETEKPGSPINAITVLQGDRTLMSRNCKAQVANALWDAEAADDPDESRVAWY